MSKLRCKCRHWLARTRHCCASKGIHLTVPVAPRSKFAFFSSCAASCDLANSFPSPTAHIFGLPAERAVFRARWRGLSSRRTTSRLGNALLAIIIGVTPRVRLLLATKPERRHVVRVGERLKTNGLGWCGLASSDAAIKAARLAERPDRTGACHSLPSPRAGAAASDMCAAPAATAGGVYFYNGLLALLAGPMLIALLFRRADRSIARSGGMRALPSSSRAKLSACWRAEAGY